MSTAGGRSSGAGPAAGPEAAAGQTAAGQIAAGQIAAGQIAAGPETAAGPEAGGGRLVAWAFVAAQAVLLVFLAALPPRGDWPVPEPLAQLCGAAALAGMAGVVLAALNLGRSLTALPLPRRDGELHTGGLYRHVRHPIYSSLLVFAASRALTSGSALRAGVFVALAVLLWHKAGWEERRLLQRCTGYAQYAARSPRLLPRWSPARGAGTAGQASA